MRAQNARETAAGEVAPLRELGRKPMPDTQDDLIGAAEGKVSLRIARMIAREVATERLPAGTVLPTEMEMTRRYQVGRPSIREALRLLEAQGLIVLRRGVGGGPVVAAPSGKDLGQTITMFLQMRSTPLAHVLDAEARLSGLIAGAAAERVADGSASVEGLSLALAAERCALGSEERLAAGIAFHDALNHIARNEVLELIVDAVGGIWATRTREVHSDVWDQEEQERMFKEHQEILKAIAAGNATRAARLARQHMETQAELDLRRQPDITNAVVDWR